MSKVHLIHGFNVSDGGEKSILRLAPHLERLGLPYIAHNYGWVGPLLLRWHNAQTIREIKDSIEPGDVLIGHSNGALICWELVQAGAPVSAVVCIQPAMRRDTLWPEDIDVLCLYNKRDWAVTFGRIWGRFASVARPWKGRHGWGAAGRHGFTAGQKRITNIDTCPLLSCLDACGHSRIFKTPPIRLWGPRIALWVDQRLREHSHGNFSRDAVT